MRALLLFALLGCSSSAFAVEAALASPNGAGECPTTAPRAATAAAPGDEAATTTAPAPATRPGGAGEPATPGSRPRTQVRWHSLLPGMVR